MKILNIKTIFIGVALLALSALSTPSAESATQGQICQVTSGMWSVVKTAVGQPVDLIMVVNDTTLCSGQTIEVNIYEWDLLRNDFIWKGTQQFAGGSAQIRMSHTFTTAEFAATGESSLATIFYTVRSQNTQPSPVSSTYLALYDTASSGNLSYACVASNNIYACSPGNKSDCSDTSVACSGKPCVPIDPSLCGTSAAVTTQTGPVVGACVNNGIYSCNSSGGLSCSTISGCSGKTCFQVFSSQCGQPAQPSQNVSIGYNIPNPLGATKDVIGLIDLIAAWIFNLAIPVMVILIIWAGIKFITSRGNTGEVQKARSILWFALVGLAIVLIGRGFVELIVSFLQS